MRRRLTAQTEFGHHAKGEAAHFANAAAKVLRALTTHQLKRCGEDLIELIEQEVPVDALRKVADRERPSSMENLADKLDAATQRRFTMRATFRRMTMDQARKLIQAHFGQVWPAEWPVHEGQTPGDFAVVAHRAHLLSEREPAVLLRWLREEIEARGDHNRGAMDFHIP